MQIVTSVYGANYLPFLYVFLDTAREHFPADSIKVLWDDIPEHEIKMMERNFEDVQFIFSEQKIEFTNINKRIPLKLRHWLDFLHSIDDGPVCFMDCDMFVKENFEEYLGKGVDLLFTWKEEEWPINIGIVVVNNSDRIRNFFKIWLEKIEEIVLD